MALNDATPSSAGATDTTASWATVPLSTTTCHDWCAHSRACPSQARQQDTTLHWLSHAAARCGVGVTAFRSATGGTMPLSSCCQRWSKICLWAPPYSASPKVGGWQLAFEQTAQPWAGEGSTISTPQRRRRTHQLPWVEIEYIIHAARCHPEGGEPYVGLSRDSVRHTTKKLPRNYRHTTDTLTTH